MENFTLRELAAGPITSKRRLNEESFYDYQRDHLVMSSDHAKEAYIVSHEFGHYLDHVSTPYGYFLDHLRKLAHRCVGQLLQSHAAWNCPILAPAYFLCRTFKDRQDEFESLYPGYSFLPEIWKRHISPWSQVIYLREAFEDSQDRTDEDVNRVLASLSNIENLTTADEIDTYTDYTSKVPDNLSTSKDTKFSPFVSFSGHNISIGSHHVFELLGILYETDGIAGHVTNSQIDPAYTSLYFASMAHLLDNKLIPKDKKSFRYFAKVMMLCGRISLFTPIGHKFKSLREGRELEWEDIHPGWRYWRAFLAATEIIKLAGYLPIAQLQDTICEFYHWPKVIDFAEFFKRRMSTSFHDLRLSTYLERYRSHGFSLIIDDDFDSEGEIVRPYPDEGDLTALGPLVAYKGHHMLWRKGDGRAEFISNFYLEGMSNDIMLTGELRDSLSIPDIDYLQFPAPQQVLPSFFQLGLARWQ